MRYFSAYRNCLSVTTYRRKHIYTLATRFVGNKPPIKPGTPGISSGHKALPSSSSHLDPINHHKKDPQVNNPSSITKSKPHTPSVEKQNFDKMAWDAKKFQIASGSNNKIEIKPEEQIADVSSTSKADHSSQNEMTLSDNVTNSGAAIKAIMGTSNNGSGLIAGIKTTTTHLKQGDTTIPNKDKINATALSDTVKDEPNYLFDTTKIIPSFQELEKSLVDLNLADYANAGSYGENGSIRLTKHGLEIFNRIHSIKEPVIKTAIIDEENIVKEFVVANLEMDDFTQIPTMLQNHPVILVQRIHDITGTIKSKVICKLTSEEGTKIGLNCPAGVPNFVLKDEQVGNSNKTQYIIPVNPPLDVKETQYNIDDRSTQFYIDEETIHLLEVMDQEASRHKSYNYSTTGYTYEELYELVCYKQNINAQEENQRNLEDE